MKKLSILLASVAFLMTTTAQAQMPKKSNDTQSKSQAKNVVKEEAKIYGTMQVFMQNNKEVVKFDFGDIIYQIHPDKKMSKTIKDISVYRFSSLSEALNTISSHGWQVEVTWTTENRMGAHQNFLISNKVGEISTVYPWEDRGSDGGNSKNPKSKGKTK